MKDGLLNINKPQDMTSFDVVAILRKALGVKKIGHFGTLDPMASGVLPIAIGKAARISEYLQDDTKEYLAEIKFGLATDTDDIWGKTIKECNDAELDSITFDAIENALKGFLGEIKQIPPMYSAIKVKGKKLYQYAREGVEIDIKERTVTIHSINLVDYNQEEKTAKIQMVCSKGTYVRSLARDLGEKLGVPSCMSALIRKASGGFDIKDAIDINDIRDKSPEEIEKLMIPMDEMLQEYGSVVLGEWESKLFFNGVNLRSEQWKAYEGQLKNNFLRVYDNEFDFIGMGEAVTKGELKAHKVLR